MQPFNPLSVTRWLVDPRPCIRCGKRLAMAVRPADQCECHLDLLTEFCQVKLLRRWVLPSRERKCGFCGGMEGFCKCIDAIRSKHSEPFSPQFLAFQAGHMHCRRNGAVPGAFAKAAPIQRRRCVELSTPVQRMGLEAPRRRFASESVENDLPSLKRKRFLQ